MLKLLVKIITKLEYVDYALVIILWALGAIATICGMPWITLGIVIMHATELVTIGLKAGIKGGESIPYSIAMCMMFGFTWWVPLKSKTNQFNFD
ncbi:MAG: hypothetical protein MJ111_01505 [Clostridia bacterium]|nr:hypothetical protein [Clostridia bacterium]